ncbi:MAG: hypothetical protein EXS32_11355 [Opitutus sp.]|nr:hypothetical protein [Opitutus sp.]
MTDPRVSPGRHSRFKLRAAFCFSSVLAAVALAQRGSTTRDGDPEMRAFEPVVIFFPPVPPPIDRPVGTMGGPANRRFTASPELAFYVNEAFYAPLSTRLAREDLTPVLRQRLDTYRAAKLAAQSQVREALDATREADAPTRQQTLETLARQQAPRIAELEQTAEKLREDLVTSEYHWSALREWHLGERNARGDSPFEISQVMRAAAFYQVGLLPAQRRLLREIAMELAVAGNDAASAAAAQPYLFFPPEPARVLLPDDLPADLAAKVAAYQTKKSALKKELYDTVYAQDHATFAFLRASGLKTLAEKQAARLTALDALAEDIRRGLVQQPPPVVKPPLPPVLMARVSTLLQARTALQKETMAKIEELRAAYERAPIQLGYNFETDGLKYVVVPGRGARNRPPEELARIIEPVRAAMAAIAENYGRHFADMVNETESIRRETAGHLGSEKPPAIEAALAAATRYALRQESEEAFREYREAVFEPGLSSGQRRLLFDGAIEKLNLPLPRGEFQPTRRASGW